MFLRNGKSKLLSILFFLLSFLLISMMMVGCDSGEDDESVAENDEPVTEEADWPNQLITVIIPFGEGGGTDRLIRELAPYLSAELGVPVIVENVGGASGMTGTVHFMDNVPKDGSFLLGQIQYYLGISTIALNIDIDIDELSVVAGVVDDHFGVFVRNDAPWNDIGDLITYIKENPGQVSFGIQPKTAPHMALASLAKATGIEGKYIEVPYDGGGQIRADVLGGHIDVDLSGIDSTVAAMGDEFKTLGIFSETPHHTLDVPLINEVLKGMGIEGRVANVSNFFFYAVHKSVKDNYPERYEILVDAFKNAITNPGYVSRLQEIGYQETYRAPEEATTLFYEMHEEAKILSALVED